MALDLGFGLEGTHVLVTGGNGAIGQVTVAAFLQAGAKVTVFDVKLIDIAQTASQSPHGKLLNDPARFAQLRVDIASPESVAQGFAAAQARFGLVQVCVALAARDLSYCPHHGSLLEMPFAQWQETFRTNVHGTFLTVQHWMRQVQQRATPETRNLSLVIIGSESGHFGELGNPDYASGKSAVQYGLLQSLRKDLVLVHPRARANAVAPGPVDTPQFRREVAENPEQYWLDCQATTALRRPVSLQGVAKAILFLASEAWSADIMGQVLNVDSGKSGKLLWPPPKAVVQQAAAASHSISHQSSAAHAAATSPTSSAESLPLGADLSAAASLASTAPTSPTSPPIPSGITLPTPPTSSSSNREFTTF